MEIVRLKLTFVVYECIMLCKKGGDYMVSVTRVNISLDNDVLKNIDDFCSESGCSRSWLISTACQQYIEGQKKLPEVISQLSELQDVVKKLQVEKIAPV